MTPFASVAMLEKLALLKIALCRAPAFSSTSSACLGIASPVLSETPIRVLVSSSPLVNGVSPGSLCLPRLADQLRGFKTALRAALQLSFGVEIGCTASEGSARRQQTMSSFYR